MGVDGVRARRKEEYMYTCYIIGSRHNKNNFWDFYIYI